MFVRKPARRPEAVPSAGRDSAGRDDDLQGRIGRGVPEDVVRLVNLAERERVRAHLLRRGLHGRLHWLYIARQSAGVIGLTSVTLDTAEEVSCSRMKRCGRWSLSGRPAGHRRMMGTIFPARDRGRRSRLAMANTEIRAYTPIQRPISVSVRGRFCRGSLGLTFRGWLQPPSNREESDRACDQPARTWMA